ncbi:MAG: pseudaminic acid synthase [Acidimicrobiales bacterium]
MIPTRAAAGSSHHVVDVGDRRVGHGCATYVIAELSANHDHDLGKARELVHVAAEAGADAVKLQTYTPDTMTLDCDRPEFRIGPGTIWEGRRLHDLYAQAMTPWEWHAPLLEEAERCGLQLFSAPFDDSAVAFLDELDVPALKIASFELTHLPLIERAAATGRPLIISTGMATIDEIDAAIATAGTGGGGGVVLLRCNSSYPAPVSEMDVCTITDMIDRWNVPVGLSDHTLGLAAALAAVSLGASVIEKHITLSRDDPGPDSAFSLEPAELALLVREIRDVEAALGSVRYGPTERERPSLGFRRSIFAGCDIAAGEELSERNLVVIRPADGLSPADLPHVVGRPAATAIARGTPLSWSLVAD